MVLSAYAQNSNSIKAFEYPDYLCPNPYTGKPIYGGNTFEISYSEKKNSYGMEFRYGYVKYSLSLRKVWIMEDMFIQALKSGI